MPSVQVPLATAQYPLLSKCLLDNSRHYDMLLYSQASSHLPLIARPRGSDHSSSLLTRHLLFGSGGHSERAIVHADHAVQRQLSVKAINHVARLFWKASKASASYCHATIQVKTQSDFYLIPRSPLTTAIVGSWQMLVFLSLSCRRQLYHSHSSRMHSLLLVS